MDNGLTKLYLYRRNVLFLKFFTKLKTLLEKLLHFNNQTGIFIFVVTEDNTRNK